MIQKKFASQLMPGISKLMETCVLENASGKVSLFVTNSNKIDDLTDLAQNFSKDFNKSNPGDGKADC
jgi:hypothetical protein